MKLIWGDSIPYDKYICPDGKTVDIAECLNHCRIANKFEAGRCLSHRTLRAISEQREWKGTPSATQLLNGTREEYLKITKNYPIDPQDSIFAIFGTGCHAFLEGYLENEKMVAEKRLTDPTGSYTRAIWLLRWQETYPVWCKDLWEFQDSSPDGPCETQRPCDWPWRKTRKVEER